MSTQEELEAEFDVAHQTVLELLREQQDSQEERLRLEEHAEALELEMYRKRI